MGFILKLQRTTPPPFMFNILEFDEQSNNIEFEISGGQALYNVVFTDQDENVLGSINGYNYNSDGLKIETLNAMFGVTTIIGTITDATGAELNDSIGVNFTTTTTQNPLVTTNINPTNLKFGAFVPNTDGKYGETTPIFQEVSLDQMQMIGDVIIIPTVNSLELIENTNTGEYELVLDYSIEIQSDIMLSGSDTINIFSPRIRLELPINIEGVDNTFTPQFAVDVITTYNIDSVAYEYNEIQLDNNGLTLGVLNSLNLINGNSSSRQLIELEFIGFNENNGTGSFDINKLSNTGDNYDIPYHFLHSNSLPETSINPNDYQPSNGLDNGFYMGGIIRPMVGSPTPNYYLASGDIGFVEDQFVSVTTTTTLPPEVPTQYLIQTDLGSGNAGSTTFEIPISTSAISRIVNFTVDWGDNTQDTITDPSDPALNHNYATAGEYVITITGELNGWRFGTSTPENRLKFKDVLQWGTAVTFINMTSAFSRCVSLTTISAIDTPILGGLTRFYFDGCTNLVDAGLINNWDVSDCTALSGFFRNCILFNQPLDSWDVSNVTTMEVMFEDCLVFNQPLDSWTTSNLGSIRFMFNRALEFNQTLGSWNVSNLNWVEGIFNGVTLSTPNYESILVGWGGQNVQSGVRLDAPNSTYTAGSAAETARNNLETNFNWDINDGGSI